MVRKCDEQRAFGITDMLIRGRREKLCAPPKKKRAFKSILIYEKLYNLLC